MEREIKRGDIYYAYMNSDSENEKTRLRPVLVLQSSPGERCAHNLVVAAIISKIKKRQLTHVSIFDVPFIDRDSVVFLEQIYTIEKQQLKKYIGTLDNGNMREINYAISVSLGFNNDIPMIMSLCNTCAKDFIDSSNIIIRTDKRQEIKEVCTYCNRGFGFDYYVIKN